MKVVYGHWMKDSTERNFPASKHRSKRILKKLLKRHGTEFVQEPSMFIDNKNGVIYAHYSFERDIQQIINDSISNPILYGPGSLYAGKTHNGFIPGGNPIRYYTPFTKTALNVTVS